MWSIFQLKWTAVGKAVPSSGSKVARPLQYQSALELRVWEQWREMRQAALYHAALHHQALCFTTVSCAVGEVWDSWQSARLSSKVYWVYIDAADETVHWFNSQKASRHGGGGRLNWWFESPTFKRAALEPDDRDFHRCHEGVTQIITVMGPTDCVPPLG